MHRDLKPENILLQAGQPIIADFGIALAVAQAGGERITQTGLSLGTPLYMSPEQASGDRSMDARTDQYALAAMTYEMLTGEPPHTGATAQVIISRLMTETPRSVREHAAGGAAVDGCGGASRALEIRGGSLSELWRTSCARCRDDDERATIRALRARAG